MTPTPKIRRAVRPVSKAKDILREVEGHLVAVRLINWSAHTFDGDDEATRTAKVAFVDLEPAEARLLGVVEITWKRVIRLLEIVPADEWQVGRLIREPDYQAVELEPEDFDVERVGAQLAALELGALSSPAPAPAPQLPLPAAGDDDLPSD